LTFDVHGSTFGVPGLAFASAPEERHVYRTEDPPQPATLVTRQNVAPKPENGNRRTENGDRRSEVGGQRSEVRDRRSEVRVGRSTFGVPSSAFGVRGSPVTFICEFFVGFVAFVGNETDL
jgi:hypothetical protein